MVALIALLLPALLLSTSEGQPGTAGVLEIKTGQRTLMAGSPGVVPVELSVKPGYKVAKRPAPKLQLNPNASFEVTVGGFAESTAAKDPDYFGVLKPLELTVVPAKTAKPGRYSLEGRLTYFYCSEKEKYCSRSIEAVQIPLAVVEKR